MSPESVEKELNCFGLYGFGGGFQHVRSPSLSGQLYCNACPLNEECWTKHKERVELAFPDSVKEMEGLVQEHGGPGAMREWWRRHRCPAPYSVVMGGNIEDGMLVGSGQEPKERGPLTIHWPLRGI